MSKKILIIEDEPDVMEYLKTVLQSNGYEALACSDIRRAHDMVSKERPDLICLDIMMPHETGISFYSKLKKDDEFADIPVIIVSGAIQQGEFDFRSMVSDCSIPPPDKYIEKPIVVDDFLDIIGELTSPKKAAKEGD